MTMPGQIAVIIVLAELFFFSGDIERTSPGDNIGIHTLDTMQETAGYMAVKVYRDGFVAAGTGGRIDRIAATGKILKSVVIPGERFNAVIADDRMIIAAGEGGAVFISTDGLQYRKIPSGTDQAVRSLIFHNNLVIGGANKGEVVIGDMSGKFRMIRLPLKGDIVSLSSGSSDCYGVTSEGEIIHSRDGLKWDITDFNQVYGGYYKPCSFTCISMTDNRIAIAGVNSDGSPAVYFSTQGTVWAERPLIYTDDQGAKGYLEDKPLFIAYVGSTDEFYLACTKGSLLRLPSCTQCNRLSLISAHDITGIAQLQNTIILAGKGFFIRTIDLGI
jgi:hypothetical protein